MGELGILAEAKVLTDDVRATCLDCEMFGTGPQLRIEAVQHVKRSGHKVRVVRSYIEELSPRPRPPEPCDRFQAPPGGGYVCIRCDREWRHHPKEAQ